MPECLKLIGKTVPERMVTGSASDKQALAKKLADTIVAMATEKH